ncbi:unnamed protein product [Pylaiella littoralis]
MHLRIFLNLIGQLIAIPAALFLMPTACPRLFSTTRTTDDSSAATGGVTAAVDEPGIMTTSAGLGPASEVMTTAEGRREDDTGTGGLPLQKKKRRGVLGGGGRKGTAGGRSSRAGGAGSGSGDGGGDELRGLSAILSGLEGATEELREAFATVVLRPIHDIPRKAGGFFSTIIHARGSKEDEAAPESDSTKKYLAELQLARESAERALGTPGWEEVAQRSGVTVWKKYFPKDEYGHRYPCVKARGIIEGSAAEVMGMIVDSARVLEYNRYSRGRTDIEHLGPHTKIVWNKAQPPLSKKLHDFCTLMHMQPLDGEEGSFMLITRATEHPKAPLLDGHVRSEILLGVTILRPAEGDPTKTEMTTVNHIISNGVPVMIADRVSTKNAIDFIQNVEIAALAAAAAPPPAVVERIEVIGVGSSGGDGGKLSPSNGRSSVPAEPVAAAA